MMPLCADQKIAVTPYSPLAAGRLTRDWGAETKRYLTDKTANQKYDKTMEQDREIVARVAPIIGATKESHLLDALPALDLKLTAEEIAYLEEPYLPHAVVGAV